MGRLHPSALNIRACEVHDNMAKSCPELLREAATLIEEALNRTSPAVAAAPGAPTPAPIIVRGDRVNTAS